MQAWERLLFKTLTGAEDFLGEHGAVLGTVPASHARERLNTNIRALERHGDLHIEQKMSARALAQSKNAARRALVVDHLAPIAAAARAELAATPELIVVRSIPPRSTPNEALIRRADEVATAVAPLAAELIMAGLPADFLDALNTARRALEEISDNRSTSLKKTRGAAEAIRKQLVAGRRQVRILDRLVIVALHGQENGLLTEWKARIAYPRRRNTIVTPGAAAGVPDTTSAAA